MCVVVWDAARFPQDQHCAHLARCLLIRDASKVCWCCTCVSPRRLMQQSSNLAQHKHVLHRGCSAFLDAE